jgi:hypothetical protein
LAGRVFLLRLAPFTPPEAAKKRWRTSPSPPKSAKSLGPIPCWLARRANDGRPVFAYCQRVTQHRTLQRIPLGLPQLRTLRQIVEEIYR